MIGRIKRRGTSQKVIDLIKVAGRGLSMAEISAQVERPQQTVKELVKNQVLVRKIYCFGSGGFDGMGFRTRAWTYIYEIAGEPCHVDEIIKAIKKQQQ